MVFALSLSVDYEGRITRKGSGKRAKPFVRLELLYDVMIRVLCGCVVSAFRRSRTKTR